MPYQPHTALSATERQSPEANHSLKTVLAATPELQTLCRSLFLTTLGRISETERTYASDIARGRYQTVDLCRIALLARRSTRQANRVALVSYVRRMADAEAKAVLPLDRALVRKTREEGEANTAVERFRYQRCEHTLDAAIIEIEDHAQAVEDLKDSLVAERAKLTA